MIIVRAAGESDVPRILEIAEDAITPAWTHEYVKSRLDRDDTLILVADSQHKKRTAVDIGHHLRETDKPTIIGFAAIRQVGDAGELLQIAVDSGHRRNGAGSLLIDAALSCAKAKDLISVFLEVRAGNEPAIALYKKHGFRQVRIRKAYYDSPAEDAVVMAFKEHG